MADLIVMTNQPVTQLFNLPSHIPTHIGLRDTLAFSVVSVLDSLSLSLYIYIYHMKWFVWLKSPWRVE